MYTQTQAEQHWQEEFIGSNRQMGTLQSGQTTDHQFYELTIAFLRGTSQGLTRKKTCMSRTVERQQHWLDFKKPFILISQKKIAVSRPTANSCLPLLRLASLSRLLLIGDRHTHTHRLIPVEAD